LRSSISNRDPGAVSIAAHSARLRAGQFDGGTHPIAEARSCGFVALAM